MVQHVTVTANADRTVTCDPSPIKIYRDDQLIRFGLGPNTMWGTTEQHKDPIQFGDGWPGGSAHPDVNNTFIADGNDPLAPGSQPQKYSVTFYVTYVPTMTEIRHDPEVENMPQP